MRGLGSTALRVLCRLMAPLGQTGCHLDRILNSGAAPGGAILAPRSDPQLAAQGPQQASFVAAHQRDALAREGVAP